jgi:hypothetical protein
MNLDHLLSIVAAVGGKDAHVELKRSDGKVCLCIMGVWMSPREYDSASAAEVIRMAATDLYAPAKDALGAMRRDVSHLELALRR